MAVDLIEPRAETLSVEEQIARMGDALYEVVNGVVVEKKVGAYANWIATRLYDFLCGSVAEHRQGELYIESVFVLDSVVDQRRRPDLAFVSAARWPIDKMPPLEGDWPFPPDLAVEVISPSNGFEEMVAKAEEYLEHGVREVWLIAPRTRYVYIHRAPGSVTVLSAGERLESPLFPGWSAAVADLIPAPAPEQPPAATGQ